MLGRHANDGLALYRTGAGLARRRIFSNFRISCRAYLFLRTQKIPINEAQTAIFLLFSPFSALNPSSDNSLFDKLCQVLYNHDAGDESTLRGGATAEDGKFKRRPR
jgi:hypothetical protein